MKNEMYKDRYDFEWNHRSHILGVTNICIVAVTILGSGLVAEAKSFNYDSSSLHWFLVLWGLSATSVIFALYYIFRALIGYGYSHIATPSELQFHYKKHVDWCNQKNYPASRANEELERFINEKMAEAVDVNLKNNKRASLKIE